MFPEADGWPPTLTPPNMVRVLHPDTIPHAITPFSLSGAGDPQLHHGCPPLSHQEQQHGGGGARAPAQGCQSPDSNSDAQWPWTHAFVSWSLGFLIWRILVRGSLLGAGLDSWSCDSENSRSGPEGTQSDHPAATVTRADIARGNRGHLVRALGPGADAALGRDGEPPLGPSGDRLAWG